MPADDRNEEDSALAARWAGRWRQLEREALEVGRAMTDPAAKRYMLFISESYRLLAERAETRMQHLAALAQAKRSTRGSRSKAVDDPTMPPSGGGVG